MKYLNKNIAFIALALIAMTSCVDDFSDANPPRPLDGPFGFAKDPSGNSFIATDTGNDTWIYLPKGGSTTFVIDVVDAPGLISAVEVKLSNSVQPEDLGTAVVTLGSAEKQSVGSVSVTYTAGDVAGDEDIEITILDGQDPAKSISFTYNTIRIADTDCFTNDLLIGWYDTVTSGFDAENGVDYTDLVGEVELYLRGNNHPGFYRFSDGSFGLYDDQGYSQNFINVVMCDNKVLDADEEFEGGFTGTIGTDGSITIDWANSFGDTGHTVMTPQ